MRKLLSVALVALLVFLLMAKLRIIKAHKLEVLALIMK